MAAPRVSRAGWNARPPKSVERLSWANVDTLYVHYTAAESDQTGDPRKRMWGIQDFHMRVKGWLDFAYNKAFSASGIILDGRGWGVKSAATGAENGRSQAVVFLGSDKAGRDDVTPKGRAALGELIREAIALKKRADGGSLVVKGHTQAPGNAGATACPGLELLSYIAMQGWVVKEPPIRWPRNFFLFASWYLGENQFKKYGPHNLKHRPKQLPGRFTPQTAALMAALRVYLRRRKR